MKKLLILLFLGISVLGSYAQNFKKNFQLKDFDKLNLGSAFVIEVIEAPTYSITVRGREEDIEDILAKVEGRELYIYYKKDGRNWKNHRAVNITIEMPKLNGVEFSGATKSKVSGFASEMFKIGLSGASSATFEIDARNLEVDCSGASSLTLVGKGQNAKVDISGASQIDALGYKIDVAAIEASGASTAKVTASKSLMIDASGASTVKYMGDASVKASTSGASSVKRMN